MSYKFEPRVTVSGAVGGRKPEGHHLETSDASELKKTKQKTVIS